MIPFRSLGFKLPAFLSNTTGRTAAVCIDLPSVEIHNVEERPEKRARTLKHLIKANHVNHSIIYSNLRFHNHCPHILGSAYILGSSHEQLTRIYDSECKTLEPWQDSPGEISEEDWRDFLGKRNYQRAYIDFFEDRLAHLGYDLDALVDQYLFAGKEPLVNNLISGLAHCLIHLGYAYELSSQAVMIEALALSACFYDSTGKYLNDPSYTKPGPNVTTNLLEILDRVAKDDRVVDDPSSGEVDELFEKSDQEPLLLEYWNDWELSDPKKQFKDSQKTAAALLVGTLSEKHPQYDFFLVHVLTSSHAVRILLPLFPAKWHLSLVRQWWLFALSAYVMVGKPTVDLSRIEDYDLKGRGWEYVVNRATTSEWADDAHFVKACRALKVGAETWGDPDQFYLKAAVRFSEEFNHWGFA